MPATLFVLLPLSGCNDSNDLATSSPPAGPENAAVSGQYRDELLTYAIDNLNRLEEFDSGDALQQIFQRLNRPEQSNASPSDRPDALLEAWPEPEMLRQIIDRLNQWIRAQPPPVGWKLDPMSAALPQPLADLPQVKDLDRMEFSRFDGYVLQEAVWLRDVGLWTRGDMLDDLQRAKCIFDWIVCNIQLEADSADRIPLFPWETLLFGRGTATERAWVFVLLLRQLGIDAAVLGLEEGREERGEGRELGTSVPSIAVSEGSSVQHSSNPQSPIPNPSPPLWCVAVLIEGDAYLFDPLLGLPIPAPDGVRCDENGRLAIEPATLAQVAADNKLLTALDADETHAYGVKASDLAQVAVMLEASPSYMSRRMKTFESRLVGAQRMVLTTSPSSQAERWKAIGQVARVQLWSLPFETLRRRSQLDFKEAQMRLAAMLPFYMVRSAPLIHGRVLHLKGRLVGDDGAIRYYQSARPSQEELSASSAHPIEKLTYLRGKQDASYWLGLIAYRRGNYPTAIDYFAKRTLLFVPDGPWTDGARYNLARSFEAAGETEKAILQYQGNYDSPGYLGDLLRAKWLKKKTTNDK